jgi:hypothetical protein
MIAFTVNEGLSGVGLPRRGFEAWQKLVAEGDPTPPPARPRRASPRGAPERELRREGRAVLQRSRLDAVTR